MHECVTRGKVAFIVLFSGRFYPSCLLKLVLLEQ